MSPPFEPAERGSVHGRVLDREGRPVPGTTILFTGAGPFPDLAPLTGLAGDFALDGVGAGPCEVRAIGPAGESGQAMVVVRPGAVTDVRITIE